MQEPRPQDRDPRAGADDGLADGRDELAAPSPGRRAPRLTRRHLLTGAAVPGATSLQDPRPASAAPPRAPAGKPGGKPTGGKPTVGTGAGLPARHGVGDPRGSDIAVAVGRTAEGRFGVMFKKAPAFAPPDELLHDLAVSMVDDRAPGLSPRVGDAQDNPDVPAGFTFLGQFVDHDMTRDATPLTLQRSDPQGTVNFETPFFDLHSVYGDGPARDPHLYDADRVHLAVHAPHGFPDLPRDGAGNALIGDPRNDDNLVVAQLHTAFLTLHNRLVDEGRSFAEARRLLCWHFQWLVVHEYLPRVCGRALVDTYLSVPPDRVRPRSYAAKNPNKPFIPIEYSVGAYRFGHSTVRAEYTMNDWHTRPVFGREGADLRGSRPCPPEVQPDWRYFVDLPGTPRPAGFNHSRRIDTRLALPLHDLPATVVPREVTPAFTDLAERNLLRGKRLGLPAGQDVARAMGLPPLGNAELGLTGAGWGGKAPLWFYVLKEAELAHGGRHLGPVGGRIVAETVLAFLALDRSSYLHARPAFRPVTTPFTVGDFLALSGTGRRTPPR